MLPHLALRPTAFEELSIVDTETSKGITKETPEAKKAKLAKSAAEKLAKSEAEKTYAAKLAKLPPAPFRVPGGRRFSELGDSRKRLPLGQSSFR